MATLSRARRRRILAIDSGLLVKRKMDSSGGPEQGEDPVVSSPSSGASPDAGRGRDASRRGAGRFAPVAPGDLVGRQHKIDAACGQGAQRHAVQFRGCRILGEDNAAFGLDGLEAQRAIRVLRVPERITPMALFWQLSASERRK